MVLRGFHCAPFIARSAAAICSRPVSSRARTSRAKDRHPERIGSANSSVVFSVRCRSYDSISSQISAAASWPACSWARRAAVSADMSKAGAGAAAPGFKAMTNPTTAFNSRRESMSKEISMLSGVKAGAHLFRRTARRSALVSPAIIRRRRLIKSSFSAVAVMANSPGLMPMSSAARVTAACISLDTGTRTRTVLLALTGEAEGLRPSDLRACLGLAGRLLFAPARCWFFICLGWLSSGLPFWCR